MEFEHQSQSEIDTDTDTDAVRPLKSCLDSHGTASPTARVAAHEELSENLQNQEDESLRIEQSETVRLRPVIADVGEWITQRERHSSVDLDEIETNPPQDSSSTLFNERNVTDDGTSMASKKLQNGDNGLLMIEQSEIVRSGPVAEVGERIMQREPYSAVYMNSIEENPMQNSPPTLLNEHNAADSESMATTENVINMASKKLQNLEDGSLQIEQSEMLHSGPVADAGEWIMQLEPHSADLEEIEANSVPDFPSMSFEEPNIADPDSTAVTGIGTGTASENLLNWDDELLEIEQSETAHSRPVTDVGEWIMQREPSSAVEIDESEANRSSPVQNVMSASLNERDTADSQSTAGMLEEPRAVALGGKTTVIEMPSPPVQAMERPESYDPFRIPSSVFERSGASPAMEWSIASNESLFSIHVGNTSFSRDHFIPLDLVHSGELASSAVPGVAHQDELEITEEESEEGLGGKTVDEVARLISGRDRGCIPPSPNYPRHSGLSYGSDSSARSFAFPLLPEGVSLKLKPEAEKLQRPEASPGSKKASSKPWLPCLAWCCCSSLCAWPRNCPSCCSWVRSCSCPCYSWVRGCSRPCCSWVRSCTCPRCSCSCSSFRRSCCCCFSTNCCSSICCCY